MQFMYKCRVADDWRHGTDSFLEPSVSMTLFLQPVKTKRPRKWFLTFDSPTILNSLYRITKGLKKSPKFFSYTFLGLREEYIAQVWIFVMLKKPSL